MADGEDKSWGEIMLSMAQQISEINGKLDGLVSHEKLSSQITDMRREMITKIDKSEARSESLMHTTVEKAVASTRARLDTIEGGIDSKAEKVARIVVAEETAKTDRAMKRANLMAISGGGAGLAAGATMVAKLMFGGG